MLKVSRRLCTKKTKFCFITMSQRFISAFLSARKSVRFRSIQCWEQHQIWVGKVPFANWKKKRNVSIDVVSIVSRHSYTSTLIIILSGQLFNVTKIRPLLNGVMSSFHSMLVKGGSHIGLPTPGYSSTSQFPTSFQLQQASLMTKYALNLENLTSQGCNGTHHKGIVFYCSLLHCQCWF